MLEHLPSKKTIPCEDSKINIIRSIHSFESSASCFQMGLSPFSKDALDKGHIS